LPLGAAWSAAAPLATGVAHELPEPLHLEVGARSDQLAHRSVPLLEQPREPSLHRLVPVAAGAGRVFRAGRDGRPRHLLADPELLVDVGDLTLSGAERADGSTELDRLAQGVREPERLDLGRLEIDQRLTVAVSRAELAARAAPPAESVVVVLVDRHRAVLTR